MDPVIVREYRARWQAVADVEEAERRRATVEERWRKLDAVFRMALSLGLDLRAQQDDEVIVWQRWARLKTGSA
jgi:hypothetical protein